MYVKNSYTSWFKNSALKDSPGYSKRYFWGLFKKKRKAKTILRPRAMSADAVKNQINAIGIGKQIEMLRVGYDGSIDDMPIMVEIIDISPESFTGRIVNPERTMIESSTEKLVYAKKGGGIIEFRYDDGDIHSITETKDEELLQQERNIESLKEMLAALETGDRVIVAYYDEKQRGTVNTEGAIIDKSDKDSTFTLQIEKINKIELEKKISRTFDIQKDLVIDLEFV